MKQLLLVLVLVLASLLGYSQTKKDTIQKIVATPAVTDSTPIIQLRDLQELNTLIQDYPAKYANPITQWLQERFQLRLSQHKH